MRFKPGDLVRIPGGYDVYRIHPGNKWEKLRGPGSAKGWISTTEYNFNEYPQIWILYKNINEFI